MEALDRSTLDQLADGCRLLAICHAAKEITGKEVVLDGRYQTIGEIHASSFQDTVHEIGHWLAASPEERMIPNLGFDLPGTDESWAAMREFQAICHHSEIVNSLVEMGQLPDDELEYVEYLELSADLVVDGKVHLSQALCRHLARPKAQEVIRIYRAKLEELLSRI